MDLVNARKVASIKMLSREFV